MCQKFQDSLKNSPLGFFPKSLLSFLVICYLKCLHTSSSILAYLWEHLRINMGLSTNTALHILHLIIFVYSWQLSVRAIGEHPFHLVEKTIHSSTSWSIKNQCFLCTYSLQQRLNIKETAILALTANLQIKRLRRDSINIIPQFF